MLCMDKYALGKVRNFKHPYSGLLDEFFKTDDAPKDIFDIKPRRNLLAIEENKISSILETAYDKEVKALQCAIKEKL